MSEINPESFIRVEGVYTSDWIPFLKTYGPLRRCSIKVKDIINLLNNGVQVKLTEEKQQALYIFIKQWNLNCEINNRPKAVKAEEVLYKMVYKQAIDLENKDDSENPFVEDPKESYKLDQVVSELDNKKNNNNTMKSPLANRNNTIKIRKPKMYDILVEKNRNLTQIQKNDIMLDTLEYGDIEFE